MVKKYVKEFRATSLLFQVLLATIIVTTGAVAYAVCTQIEAETEIDSVQTRYDQAVEDWDCLGGRHRWSHGRRGRTSSCVGFENLQHERSGNR